MTQPLKSFLLHGELRDEQINIGFSHVSLETAVKELERCKSLMADEQVKWLKHMRNYIRFHGTGNPRGSINSDRYTETDRILAGKVEPSIVLFGRKFTASRLLAANLTITELAPTVVQRPVAPAVITPLPAKRRSRSKRRMRAYTALSG